MNISRDCQQIYADRFEQRKPAMISAALSTPHWASAVAPEPTAGGVPGFPLPDTETISLVADPNCQGQTQPLGLYIHIPFCAQKCPYCDFNTYARLEPLYESYTRALCQELGRWAERLAGRTVHTVFIGGGTPTVLSAGQLAQILETVHDRFALATDVEITSEANPGIVDQGQFALLYRLGVNRLSMGAQSFQAEELAFLGRIHCADDTLRAYEAALKAGFSNVNLDFMFGLPRQAPQAWNDTLSTALAIAPQHLSLYSLIVEPNTPLSHWVQTGQAPPPDDDLAADMYEAAMARLQTAGYCHYELSNWARSPAFSCRHNLLYWRNQEWIGVGPGAHSHLRWDHGRPARRQAVAARWSNRRGVQSYIKQFCKTSGASPVDFYEELSHAVSMGETMMLGLRLVQEGVPFTRFEEVHGQTARAVFGPQLDRLQNAGLLESDDERVRLTRKGLLVGNQVFSEFIA